MDPNSGPFKVVRSQQALINNNSGGDMRALAGLMDPNSGPFEVQELQQAKCLGDRLIDHKSSPF